MDGRSSRARWKVDIDGRVSDVLSTSRILTMAMSMKLKW